MHTVFTLLNAAATISPVTKIDAATIQGWLLLEGSVYCTKHSLLHAATTQTYFKFEEVPGLLCHNVYTLKRRCTVIKIYVHITRETQIIAAVFIQWRRLCVQLWHSLRRLFKCGDYLRCGV